MNVDVLAVPENSVVVLAGLHVSIEEQQMIQQVLSEAIGHDRFVVFFLDSIYDDVRVVDVEPDVLDAVRKALEAP